MNANPLERHWQLDLIRHGDTPATEAGRVCGTLDVPLSPRGVMAVQRFAAAWPAEQRRAMHWVASPMRRTRQTAEQLIHSGDLVTDARLRELDFGEWEGLLWSEVHARQEAAMAWWAADWVNRAPPGGESFADLVTRARDWSDGLDARHVGLEGVDPGALCRLAVVCHGGTVRALLCALLDWPLDTALRYSVDPVHVCRLMRCAGRWRVMLLNAPAPVPPPEWPRKAP